MRPIILNLDADPTLFENTAGELGAITRTLERRSFPDGETYVRYAANCRGRDVILLSALDRPNAKILPLLLTAATLRDLGAQQIGLIAPYLPYMRQDIRFRSGEGITSRYFARLLSSHFDWLTTADPHLHRFQNLDELYSIPTEVAHTAPLIAAWIAANVKRPLLVGPDHESRQWVGRVAARIDAPFQVLRKSRTGDRNVTVSIPAIEQFRDFVPVLVDDIASTGRTLLAALEHLKSIGTPPPVCVVVHGLFVDGADTALYDAGADQVVSSNSIAHATNALDLSPGLASAARILLCQ